MSLHPTSLQKAHSISFWQSLRVAGMWLFLAPLIVILGTVDFLTKGRTRSWP